MKMSSYLANEVLSAVTKGGSVTYPQLYISIHSADPADTGAYEIAEARQLLTTTDWGTVAVKQVSTVNAVEFSNMTVESTVAYIGLWDSLTGGNFLWSGDLSNPKTVPTGETLRFDAGNITAEIDPA